MTTFTWISIVLYAAGALVVGYALTLWSDAAALAWVGVCCLATAVVIDLADRPARSDA